MTGTECLSFFSHSSVSKGSACNAGDPGLISWVGKILWRRERLPTPVFLGFSCGSPGKESACNVGDLGLIPGLERSPGEGKGYPLQYSGLENSMDGIVHGVSKNRTHWATFTVHFSRLVELPRWHNPPANAGDIRDAGLIPGLGRSPGGVHGNPLHVFLPGKSSWTRSLVGYSPWDHRVGHHKSNWVCMQTR